MNNESESKKLIRVLQYYHILELNCVVCEKVKVLCPFHGDVNASLLIDLGKGTFYCFGCGKRGGALEFVAEIEHLNLLQASIQLYRILNCEANSKQHNIRILPANRLTVEQSIYEAKRYFYSLPKTDWTIHCRARQYMLNRGFYISTLRNVDARENFNGDYEIVFPIKENGAFRGYVCRATNRETEQKRKYLYNTGFSRRNTLFGNYNVSSYVVIVEGSMDYFKLCQFGITNSVAILGWKITDEQIKKIKQYTTNVVSALDNTETGNRGTEYLKQFFNVVRFKYPEYIKDTGDLDIYDFNKAWQDTLFEMRIKWFDNIN